MQCDLGCRHCGSRAGTARPGELTTRECFEVVAKLADLDTCKAGCSWTSHSLFGKPGNNPYCIHRALDFEQRGLRERLELVEMPPGVPFDNGLYQLIEEPLPPGDEPAAISGVDIYSVRTATFATQGLASPDIIHAALQCGGDWV